MPSPPERSPYTSSQLGIGLARDWPAQADLQRDDEAEVRMSSIKRFIKDNEAKCRVPLECREAGPRYRTTLASFWKLS